MATKIQRPAKPKAFEVWFWNFCIFPVRRSCLIKHFEETLLVCLFFYGKDLSQKRLKFDSETFCLFLLEGVVLKRFKMTSETQAKAERWRENAAILHTRYGYWTLPVPSWGPAAEAFSNTQPARRSKQVPQEGTLRFMPESKQIEATVTTADTSDIVSGSNV